MSETQPQVGTPSSAGTGGTGTGESGTGQTSTGQTGTTQTGTTQTGTGQGAETRPEPTGWVGWVLFAGCMMILLGAFQVIAGLVALFNRQYYVTADNLLVAVNYSGWGWVHLAVGVLVALAGFGVLTGQTWARLVGIVFAGISAIVNLGFLAAYPVWSVVLIALDIIVIYALSVHGREVQPA